jgi:cytochrome b involved in lipid metabolism
MKNTKLIIVFLVATLLLVFVITLIVNSYKTKNIEKELIPDTANTTNTIPEKTEVTQSYTLAEVATHADASSCFTIVRTNVYNLTSWINKHPGGSKAILALCGKDGTSLFENKHGGQERPENELQGFEIGVYKK